jgi:hypothetical protein
MESMETAETITYPPTVDTSYTTLSNLFSETRRKKIQCKPELIMESLQRFYSSHPDIAKIFPYIRGTSSISLRIIDWFVTKFSRKNFTTYTHNEQSVIVYKSYKGQLDAYNKIFFDTNCRRERIAFSIEGQEEPLITTIGQLNFFRWALEIGLIDYIEANIADIKSGYNQYLKETNIIQRQTASSTQNSVESTASTASAGAGQSSSTAPVNSGSGINIYTTGKIDGMPPISINTVVKPFNGGMTRRRRTKQIESSLKQLQISNSPEGVSLSFR